jgi:predicted metal-dependent HD superfamily phosphohydrolase
MTARRAGSRARRATALPEARFVELWRRAGARRAGTATYRALAKAYGEAHRAYHSASHVAACLSLLDEVAAPSEARDAVELALWFHDAVYDPKAKDNEEESARWAERSLGAAGAPKALARRVGALVRATARHEPQDDDEALVVDVDLGILGASRRDYARFEAAIRREYAFVPDEAFREGRGAVLRRFLQRRPLFHRPELRARLEARARENLAWALARLEVAP